MVLRFQSLQFRFQVFVAHFFPTILHPPPQESCSRGANAKTETVTAYNPVTGEVAWQGEHPSRTNIGSSGNLATAGDVVFQGSDTGDFYGLDARAGRQLFRYSSPKGIRASPLTYQVHGKQFVAVVATSTILTFGLP
ncbi:MAG TPA: PQQ-binding-like beta-propeller repeat protein [Gemmataceae bacterium]|nr:PQQ-binding-like beta-propeller repeat protein [Gemmataceae bacterium]